MINQRELSLISNDLYKASGGRRVPDQTIELDYALGWFLSELAQHSFGNYLAFKGGTALRRCYFWGVSVLRRSRLHAIERRRV
jgi:predicted nucleotidyltransferase component of viral defense system